MKRYLIIPIALLAFILFTAKRCEDDQGANSQADEEELSLIMDTVKSEFEAEYLDDESLFVYTRKAKQKLKDYSDYRNIANDSSLDSAFRSQASVMIKELFYPGLDSRGSPTPVSSPGQVTSIDSIWIIKPFHLTGDNLYKGILGFREEVKDISRQDRDTNTSSVKNVEILATKSTKFFGSDSLQIWQIYLGIIHY